LVKKDTDQERLTLQIMEQYGTEESDSEGFMDEELKEEETKPKSFK